MEIAFECPFCSADVLVDSEYSGDQASCPSCSNTVLIPAAGVGPGTVLGGFEVDCRLGVGGMGEVFLARQVAMDRKVALKVLPPAMTKNAELLKRFLHEVRMSGKLEHPNIVTAFDAGEDSGFHYLAMSYIEGEDLDLKLTRDGIFTEAEALRIAVSIAEALEYAWDKFKLLHRDIKPANIMVDAADDVKLMDMGIAKSIAEDSHLTNAGLFVGTPYYMSPEQARSDDDIDFRADIYSLGATLFHLLTNEYPFNAESSVGVLAKHMSEPLMPPRVLNKMLSVQCNDLVVKMMAKDRNERHHSWKAFIEHANRVLDRGRDATLALATAPTEVQGGPQEPATIGLAAAVPETVTSAPKATAAPPVTVPTTVNTEPPTPATTVAPAPTDAVTITVPKFTDISPPVRNAIVATVVIAVLIGVTLFMKSVYVGVKDDEEQRQERAVNKKQERMQTERQQVGDIDAAIEARRRKAEIAAEAEQRQQRLQEMVNYARSYWQSNPHSLDLARQNFENIQKEGEATQFAMMVTSDLQELDRLLAEANKNRGLLTGRWGSIRVIGEAGASAPKRIGLELLSDGTFHMRLVKQKGTGKGSGAYSLNGDAIYFILPGKTPRKWTFRLNGERLMLTMPTGDKYELARVKPDSP